MKSTSCSYEIRDGLIISSFFHIVSTLTSFSFDIVTNVEVVLCRISFGLVVSITNDTKIKTILFDLKRIDKEI